MLAAAGRSRRVGPERGEHAGRFLGLVGAHDDSMLDPVTHEAGPRVRGAARGDAVVGEHVNPKGRDALRRGGTQDGFAADAGGGAPGTQVRAQPAEQVCAEHLGVANDSRYASQDTNSGDLGHAVGDARAMSLDYRWVIPGELAAGAHPARDMPQADALALLQRNGVRAVLTLYEQPIDAGELAAAGLDGRHIAVADGAAPTLEQLREGVLYIAEHATQGHGVFVHCWGGVGRTGTFAAAYLASTGMAADAAVDRIRALRPGSVETSEQLNQVRAFAASLSERNHA